jgi:succinoglycan biosynthesis protein ExoM
MASQNETHTLKAETTGQTVAETVIFAFKILPTTVIIPTFRRPEGLRVAVQSILRQTVTSSKTPFKLVVCDNSPEGSARSYVEGLKGAETLTIIYIHEPNPGVANARNAAIRIGCDPFIAFLDDDEEAPENWLHQMLKVQAEFKADITFGPVKARLKGEVKRHKAYFDSFFSRTGPMTSGLIDTYYGCGNSLIRRDCLPRTSEVFSSDRNECGGEDDKLFYGLKHSGAKIAWASDALVYEDVPENRSKLSYTLKRAFAYGQGPSTSAMAGTIKKPLVCIYWMLNGLLQTLIFTPIGLVLFGLRAKNAASILDRAARGLGKLIWFPPFKVGFYGTALLKPKPKGS